MNFRVYAIIYAPILERTIEVLIPVDRRIHDLITLLKKNFPELSQGYYGVNEVNLYNKSNGNFYKKNEIIKDTDIKMGTRLVLI